jgi:transposase
MAVMSVRSKQARKLKRSSQGGRLPDTIPACHDEILRLEAELEWFRRQMFGQKSERIVPAPAEQPELFGAGEGQEETQAAPVDPEPPAEACSVAAHTRHKHGRRDLAGCPELPIGRRVVHDVSEEEKTCPCCGKPKTQLPSKVSYQVGITRPQMFRVAHERLQWGCPDCCEAHVVTADRPMELVERCMADASLLAHVAVSKFADHLPLYRQEAMLRRAGFDVSRQTLCGWLGRAGVQLKPLAEEMLRRIVGSRHAHVDETTLPVLAPGRTRRTWVWSLVGGADAPYCVYRHTPGRGRAGPLDFLSDFNGILQTDAYAVYENLSRHLKVPWAACWAHVRRKFVDAFRLTASKDADHAVTTIRQLYDIEREAREFDEAGRCELRRERSAPIIARFFDWLEEQQFRVLPSSCLGMAIAYALNLREQLRVYLDHGFVGIDNNPVERALRPVVIGRKNYLFAGSDEGAETAAVFYSLVESAKRRGLNVGDYIEDVMRRLASHPRNRIHQLLPDQWQPQPATGS